MRFIFLLACAVLFNVLLFAQSIVKQEEGSQLQLADRFSKPEFQVYRQNTFLVGGTPQWAYIRNNQNGNYQAALGFYTKVEYFPAAHFAVGVSGGMFNSWSNLPYFSRRTDFGLISEYYFYQKRRLAVYCGLHANIIRFHYEPKLDWQFLNDSIDGQQRTHYIPTIGFPLGMNFQWGKHITSNFGLGYTRAFLGGKTGRSPTGSFILFDFGVNYHITPRIVSKDRGKVEAAQ